MSSATSSSSNWRHIQAIRRTEVENALLELLTEGQRLVADYADCLNTVRPTKMRRVVPDAALGYWENEVMRGTIMHDLWLGRLCVLLSFFAVCGG